MNVYLKRFCFLMALIVTGNLSAQDVRTGLVSYWPFDEVVGTKTPDLCFGNHLGLINLGTTNLVTGQRGNAFQLSGTAQYLGMVLTNDANTVTNNLGLPIYSAKRYTVMMWVKGAAGQVNKGLFCEGGTASNNPLLLLGTRNGAGTGVANVLVRTTGGTALVNNQTSSQILLDNTWHHLAWVDDNGTAKLYIDGNLDPVVYNNTQGSLTLNTISIGAVLRATASLYFAGTIDEVALWERPLAQSEIQEVMTNGIATPIPVAAPILLTPPASVTKNVGDWTIFSVKAIGHRPFTYQWLKNGDGILDATNTTFRVNNLTTNDSGDNYSVLVTNPGGTTTSTNATLTVLPDAEPALASGIISYWPFDSVTNTTTPDLYSQNNMALNAMDETSLVTGRFGNALTFDGLTQSASRVGGFPVYNNTTYSVSLWVKGDGLTQDARRVFSECSNTNNAPLFTLGTDAGGTSQLANVYIRNDANSALVNARKSTRVVFDNNWHLLTWVDSNGQGKLYVDGVLDETDFTYTRSALTPTVTSVGAILRAAPGNYFWGAIDDVAVWSRALSFAEIQKIFTEGIPAPLSAVPPSFTQQPVGTNIFSKADVTFKALVTGTSPLWFQWTKNGGEISGATTNTLVLSNVQINDSGTYSLVVTNEAGITNSAPAVLVVTERPAPPASLAIDFNHRAPIAEDMEAGFETFSLPGSGTVTAPTSILFGGVEVTVVGTGSPLDSRKRGDVVNTGEFTEAKLLQDFVFATSAASTNGMEINVKYMTPNQTYSVTVWSFDSGSVGSPRLSDWYANGTLVKDNHSFIGSAAPTNNSQYRFDFTTAADANGTIQIQGRREESGTGAAIFVNALKIEIPPITISGIERTNGNLRVTFFTPNPELTHQIEEKSELSGIFWGNVTGVTFSQTGPNTLQADFPAPTGVKFYRIKR